VKQAAQLCIDGKIYDIPVVIGTEGERALDISKLRQLTGLVTIDPGL